MLEQSQPEELVVHNWVVVEGKMAAVGERRRCIVAVQVAPVELP